MVTTIENPISSPALTGDASAVFSIEIVAQSTTTLADDESDPSFEVDTSAVFVIVPHDALLVGDDKLTDRSSPGPMSPNSHVNRPSSSIVQSSLFSVHANPAASGNLIGHRHITRRPGTRVGHHDREPRSDRPPTPNHQRLVFFNRDRWRTPHRRSLTSHPTRRSRSTHRPCS